MRAAGESQELRKNGILQAPSVECNGMRTGSSLLHELPISVFLGGSGLLQLPADDDEVEDIHNAVGVEVGASGSGIG